MSNFLFGMSFLIIFSSSFSVSAAEIEERELLTYFPEYMPSVSTKIAPIKRKILMTSFILDGIGDWVHLINLATAIKKDYSDFDLVLAISTYKENPEATRVIRQNLEETAIFSEVYIQFKDVKTAKISALLTKNDVDNIRFLEEKYFNLNDTNFSRKFADEQFKNSFCLCVQIATSIKIRNAFFDSKEGYLDIPNIHQWFYDNSRPILVIEEHGAENGYDDDPKIIERHMGLGTQAHGIRMYKEWYFPLNDAEKSNIVENLDNKQFKDHLLRDSESASKYISEYSIIPMYVQSEAQLELLLRYNLEYFTLDNFATRIDFFVPEKYFSLETKKFLLENYPENIDLISPATTTFRAGASRQFRIFHGFMLNDRDYRNLYRLGTLGAAASGDDTLCMVLSSHNLPMLGCKGRSKVEEDSLATFAIIRGTVLCPATIEYRSLQELCELAQKLGFETLEYYFSIMLRAHNLYCVVIDEEVRAKIQQLSDELVACRLANQSTIYLEFIQFREKLFAEYDFFKKLPAIIEEGFTKSLQLRPSLDAHKTVRYYFNNTEANIELLRKLNPQEELVQEEDNYFSAVIPSHLLNSTINNGYRESLGIVRYFINDEKMVALREQLEASSFISLEQGENNRGKRGWILTLPDSLDKKIRSIIGLAPKPPKVKIVADGHDFIPSLSLVKMGIFMEYDFQVEKVESNNKSIYVSLTNSKDAECMIKRGVLQLRGKMFLVERP